MKSSSKPITFWCHCIGKSKVSPCFRKRKCEIFDTKIPTDKSYFHVLFYLRFLQICFNKSISFPCSRKKAKSPSLLWFELVKNVFVYSEITLASSRQFSKDQHFIKWKTIAIVEFWNFGNPVIVEIFFNHNRIFLSLLDM